MHDYVFYGAPHIEADQEERKDAHLIRTIAAAECFGILEFDMRNLGSGPQNLGCEPQCVGGESENFGISGQDS